MLQTLYLYGTQSSLNWTSFGWSNPEERNDQMNFITYIATGKRRKLMQDGGNTHSYSFLVQQSSLPTRGSGTLSPETQSRLLHRFRGRWLCLAGY